MFLKKALVFITAAILFWILNDVMTNSEVDLPIDNQLTSKDSETRHDWGWSNSHCLKKFYVKETNVLILVPSCEF